MKVRAVLVLLRREILRADLANDKVVSLVRASRPEEASLATVAKAAAGLGPRVRGSALVLAEDLYTATITMRSNALRNAGAEATGQALAIEVQLQAGLASSDSALAWRAAGEAAFTVVALPRIERDQVDLALDEVGLRLAGLAHPAGVPAPLADAGPEAVARGAWRRFEIWPELVAEVESNGGVPLVRLRRPDPTRRARAEVAATETLIAPGAAAPLDAGEGVLRLDDDATARRWIEAWVRVLDSESPAAPCVRPVARTTPRRSMALVALLALAVVAVGAFFHSRSKFAERDALAREFALVRAPADRVAKLTSDGASVRAELVVLEAEVAAATPRSTAPKWTAQQLKQMLSTLSTERPEDTSIEELEIGVGRSFVRGVALESRLVDHFGDGVARALGTDWIVEPTRKRLRPGTRVYDFELQIRPVGTALAPFARGEDG